MNKPLPDFIKNAPRLQAGLELYMYAFRQLSNSRANGMQMGFIPYSEICAFIDHNGISGESSYRLQQILMLMDDAYVDWHRKQKPPPPPPKGRGR